MNDWSVTEWTVTDSVLHLLWVRGTVSDLLWDIWSWNSTNISLTKWRRDSQTQLRSISSIFCVRFCELPRQHTSRAGRTSSDRGSADARAVLHAKYIHLGCADKSALKALANPCTVQFASLLFLKSLLVFHLAAAPGHRMRQLHKQRACRDIRYSRSLFLCCSWCVSSYSVLQHFSDEVFWYNGSHGHWCNNSYTVFLKWLSRVTSHRVCYTWRWRNPKLITSYSNKSTCI